MSFRLFMILCVLPLTGFGQELHYQTTLRPPATLSRVVNLSEVEGFDLVFEQRTFPNPSGNSYAAFLQSQKSRQKERIHPEAHHLPSRSAVAGPVILADFLGNNVTSGRPLDNHMAVSNAGQVVSVINTHFAVFDTDGGFIKSTFFANLFSALNINDRIFDPRILYDPAEDKWILVMMSGFDCSNTQVIVGFSRTPDATGLWNFYLFDGCPFDDDTFADYPMIGMSRDALFLTYNGVHQDSTWQAGFTETIILQIDKASGYAGGELQSRQWDNIRYAGRSIRNLRPVKGATESMYAEMHFLSNRNFDLENDTIFLLALTGTLDNAELDLDVLTADVPYGVPPDAEQPSGLLATNDARILDAIRIGDQVQFVGNTVDFSTGFSAVYHGIISDLNGSPAIRGNILTNGIDHFGYPGIGYTGVEPGDRDAIIIASHSAIDRAPGYSAIYFDGASHSDWITVKEGDSHIEMIPSSDLERWGDYSGNQRKYDEPGVVWVSSSFGALSRRNNTWLAKLGRPDLSVSTTGQTTMPVDITLYPNPASHDISVDFKVPDNKYFTAGIYDMQGVPHAQVYSGHTKYAGDGTIHFNTHTLAPGHYILHISGKDGTLLATRKFAVVR